MRQDDEYFVTAKLTLCRAVLATLFPDLPVKPPIRLHRVRTILLL